MLLFYFTLLPTELLGPLAQPAGFIWCYRWVWMLHSVQVHKTRSFFFFFNRRHLCVHQGSAATILQSLNFHCSCCRHWPLASVGAVGMLVVWEAVDDSMPLQLSATLWPAHIAFSVWKTACGATFIFNRSTMILGWQEEETGAGDISILSRFSSSCFWKC